MSIANNEAASSVRTKLNASLAKTDYLTVTASTDLDAIRTKVAGIESGADVTDATNVAAAGAVMNGGALGTPTSGTLTACTGAPLQNVIVDSTTARTLAIDDAGAYIRLTHASGCAVTVPPNSSVAFAVGTVIVFRVAAAGSPSIVQGSGVTVNNYTAAASLTQHGTFAIVKVDTNVWDYV